MRMATNKAVKKAYASFQSRFQVLQRELVSCCEPVAKLFPRLIAGSRSASNADLIQAPSESYSDLVLLGKLQLHSDCDHCASHQHKPDLSRGSAAIVQMEPEQGL